ncbi:UNVERIFIED_CONTAM: hypothetical protein Sradi_0367900 [Sesamum radiatum]|uniref:Complex 1 LYR protein domain-containing protein n=1 Tax=Sesamum radiatum TaxID=300843 RepID=A0AAW2W4J4_SESRA
MFVEVKGEELRKRKEKEGRKEMGSAPTRSEDPTIFRREYAKRRTVDSFRHNRRLSDPAEAAAAFAEGKSQLGVAKRQAVVYSLYAPRVKSVMEINGS